MDSQLVEKKKGHLSYVVLDDAASKRRHLETREWQHLRNCYECTVRLAYLAAVEVDFEQLRKRFPAP